ncbi:hypothetical protein TNIN_273511 [Trichonephila inaurata madagascariensis]|uniref:SAP domain-containing protein n=1 Tax=Trichonephila inaurata madagascariensis TaxID=2747483 RepID=A0A8X6XSX9_9ARAC|nr:hypothetical protein TNIN_273511 [Trichonephila inaurata madagascariensis]
MESTSARPKMNVTTAKPSKSKQKYVIRDYKAMSKDDLRHELRRRGIKNSGKKAELFFNRVKKMEFNFKHFLSDGEIPHYINTELILTGHIF